MRAAIENPAKCEVRGVIRFLWAKKLPEADIHRELCAVYGPNILSEGEMLTEIHKTSRMGAALEFLSRYHTNGEDFLNRIVTGDARARNLGSSCQCGDKTTVYGMGTYLFSNPAEEVRQTLSARKLMVIVFWDAQGILLIEFMTRGTTINSEVYCRTLKKL
ncbi:hypothetical protein AVEN_3496-1 [Araneus ventricosus]|uniref:Uncharacterized protein n=1 Tax=Araneus ventricosus TaxID=182803 RepID=A0A4Y2UJL3_ARAVE|nr:hypothetical protein AVEN_3496-1 [Araneus ventricosus]